jgi:hypothetical protein
VKLRVGKVCNQVSVGGNEQLRRGESEKHSAGILDEIK